MVAQTLFVEPAFFENFDSEKPAFDYTLAEEEKLCFTCQLTECKESSNKCPINIFKKEAKKS